MRLLALLILLLSIGAGVVVGALNADLVGYDLAFAQVQWPKGAALLVALVFGWLLGGLTAWLGTRLGHRRARRRARRAESGNGTSAGP
ncbi:LapA family protein [Frateuria defendens]|uniref:LapA family protein n=1 Tax=Frateuria defendens TaxID=2219559 RepID=UPI00066FEA8F|nr:LapA family protein [Frateuria defendens]